MDRKELWAGVSPKRTIPVVGKIDNELYVVIRDLLWKMAAESPAPITLIFDSGGGEGFSAFQLGDVIKMIPNETIAIILDARSAAGILTQFCTKRLITASGRIFIHSGQPTPEAVTWCKMDQYWEESLAYLAQTVRRTREQALELFCSRTGLSLEKIQEITKRGDDHPYSHIYAAEALELKLVDGILPSDYKIFIPVPSTQKPQLE